MSEDPATAVYNLMQADPNIIAAAVIKGKEIIYTTDNWNISGDVGRVVSSWIGQSARFIMVTGVKYSVLRMEPELLVAISLKGEGSICAAKDDEHKLICYLQPDGDARGAVIDVQRAIGSMSSKAGNLPFPYIFKPPSPPDDIAPTGQQQLMIPITKKKSEFKLYCKYCGTKLPKGQSICHVCKKKVI